MSFRNHRPPYGGRGGRGRGGGGGRGGRGRGGGGGRGRRGCDDHSARDRIQLRTNCQLAEVNAPCLHMYRVDHMWRMTRERNDAGVVRYIKPAMEPPEKQQFKPGSSLFNLVMKQVRQVLRDDEQNMCYRGAGSEVLFDGSVRQPPDHLKRIMNGVPEGGVPEARPQKRFKEDRAGKDPVPVVELVVAADLRQAEKTTKLEHFYVCLSFCKTFQTTEAGDELEGLIDALVQDDFRYEQEMEPVRRLLPRTGGTPNDTNERQSSFYFLPDRIEKAIMPSECRINDHRKIRDHIEARIGVKRTTLLGFDGHRGVSQPIVATNLSYEMARPAMSLVQSLANGRVSICGLEVNPEQISENDQTAIIDRILAIDKPLHMKYQKSLSGPWARKMRANQNTTDEIEKKRWQEKTYVRIYGAKFNHEFDFEEKRISVAKFFEMDATGLKYPKLPVLALRSYVQKDGTEVTPYIPVEFFSYVEGAGPNPTDKDFKTENSLKFHNDSWRSTIDKIEQTCASLRPMRRALRLSDPKTVTGKVLKQPTILHGKNQTSVVPSFQSKTVFCPTTCRSWAVLNYSRDKNMVREKLKQMLRTFQDYHRLEFPEQSRIDELIHSPTNAEDFDGSIAKSRRVFLRPGAQVFHDILLWTVVEFNEQAEQLKLSRSDRGQNTNITVHPDKVKCPEIVFVVLPDEMKTYGQRKLDATRKFHFPIQVLNADKFMQSRPAYFISVAMKVNTKLTPSRWKSIPRARKLDLSRSWILQQDTAVIGIVKASRKFFLLQTVPILNICVEAGRDGKEVVAGSVLLDPEGLHMSHDAVVQSRTRGFHRKAIASIIIKLLEDYCRLGTNRRCAKRIVVYGLGEDSSSADGDISFIRSVRLAVGFFPLYMKEPHPKVTVIMANCNHPLVIVDESNGKNVPSGTCIDSTAGLFRGLPLDATSFDRNSAGAFDDISFFLLAQDGQLGVSKGMFYRCSWNENKTGAPQQGASAFDKEEMSKLTYDLSFCVGTAQCATRLPAVLFYPKKLAEMTLGWIPSLQLTYGKIGGVYKEKSSGYCDLVQNLDCFPHFLA